MSVAHWERLGPFSGVGHDLCDEDRPIISFFMETDIDMREMTIERTDRGVDIHVER